MKMALLWSLRPTTTFAQWLDRRVNSCACITIFDLKSDDTNHNVFDAPAPMIDPVIEEILHAPAITINPHIEYPTCNTNANEDATHATSVRLVCVALARVLECIASTRVARNNLDISGLVNPPFSKTSVEAPTPQVVGSLPPPVNQAYRELNVARKTTQNVVTLHCKKGTLDEMWEKYGMTCGLSGCTHACLSFSQTDLRVIKHDN